ncbi:hypothetical protein MRX96_057650 [Rhipicephalus microplus]
MRLYAPTSPSSRPCGHDSIWRIARSTVHRAPCCLSDGWIVQLGYIGDCLDSYELITAPHDLASEDPEFGRGQRVLGLVNVK